MREFEHEIGSINIQAEIGLSGHPGLVGEVYKLPVHVPGRYWVTTVTDEIERRRKIILLADECADTKVCDKSAGQWMTNESHGGVMLAEFADVVRMQKWLDDAELLEVPNSSKFKVWNQIADGFTDQILDLSLVPGLDHASFAMVSGQDYFFAYPIFKGELICGYSILCDCTAEGVQRDRKPHGWEEIEARGELIGYMNRKDFVKCPHCDVSFKVTARSSWNGYRHLKCWGPMKLQPKEDVAE